MCLSVSQPFADLIVSGKKTIEMRSWNTRFRGEFLVHAPLRVRTADCRRLRLDSSTLTTGALVGKAELYNVKMYTSYAQVRADRMRHYAASDMCTMDKKRYGFEIRRATKFRASVPCSGRLGFFQVREPESTPTDASIVLSIMDEEHRYGLVGHH